MKPLSPASYKVQFTVSRDTQQKLREVQDLMRHRVPSGDIALIFDRALTMLLTELRRERHADVHRPRDSRGPAVYSRHVPAAVKEGGVEPRRWTLRLHRSIWTVL